MATPKKVRIPAPTYTYRATLSRMVDGDTLDLSVDVGFYFRAEVPIRLDGLNAAEKNTPAGKAAMAWVSSWLSAHPDLVVTTKSAPEKFGRWLGTVVGGDGQVLNDELIKAGHALPWDGKGPRPV